MPTISPFSSRRKTIIPVGNKAKPIARLDFRGLDTTSPYDAVKDNHTPFAHDFRMYAEEADQRQVSITSRKGSGPYIHALSSAIDQQNTSTTGAADASVGLLTEWKAMKYTAGATGPLTQIDLR